MDYRVDIYACYAYFKFGTVVHDFGFETVMARRLILLLVQLLHCTPLWWKRIRVNSGKCICDGTREAYYNIWDVYIYGYTAVCIEEIPLGLLTTRCICISINNYNAFRISEHTWRVRFQDECPCQVVTVNGLFTCV